MIGSALSPLVFHNVKVKTYPDRTRHETICSKPIFKDSGWELYSPDLSAEKISKPKNMTNDVRPDSVRRAKQKIFDIALCNDYRYFVTWTLNKDKIDRFSSDEVSKKLKSFLRNMVDRNDLLYLVIPEHHKNGAIHMHGLMSGNFKLVDSGRRTLDGKTIYNMPQWKFGFSTAIEITGDRSRVSKYITKYVSKEFRKIFGSFYYAGGRGLVRSPSIQLYDIDYEKVNSKAYGNPDINLFFKYQTYEPEALS